mgnify:CR=1 FL=1
MGKHPLKRAAGQTRNIQENPPFQGKPKGNQGEDRVDRTSWEASPKRRLGTNDKHPLVRTGGYYNALIRFVLIVLVLLRI